MKCESEYRHHLLHFQWPSWRCLYCHNKCYHEIHHPFGKRLMKPSIRLWAQNLNVLLLCNPVTTQWCGIRGQMSHNVSKRAKLL